MKDQTGLTYTASQYAKSLCVAEAKLGKTVTLVGSILGVLPWQKNGGVVDKPSHLHILSFDQGALSGIARFITESCKAPKEALAYRVYNFQDDVRRVALGGADYDFTLFNSIIGVLARIHDITKIEKGVHAVMVSSLTKMVEAVQRGLFGPPATREATASDAAWKKSRGSADMNKWTKYGQLVSELRDYTQVDDWHTFWEGHISRSGGEDSKEQLAIQGKSAYNFALNVEQVFRIRRNFNQKAGDTAVDQTYFDTQPVSEFIVGGREFNERLQPKEPDLTTALHKLGLKTGCWNRKAKLAS